MTVTLGFAMRIGDFPQAVMLPPAVAPVEARPAVIEGQLVSGSTSISSGISHAGSRLHQRMQGQQFFRHEALTYTRQGASGTPPEASGFNLDLFI